MLTIKFKAPDGITHEKNWWTGMPVPHINSSRVVEFWADGHELTTILKALHSTRPSERKMQVVESD